MTIAGVLAVAAGIAVFAFPLESYVALSILFGVLMLVVGAAKLIAASTSGNYFMMRGYVITGGVLDLILGLFLCRNTPRFPDTYLHCFFPRKMPIPQDVPHSPFFCNT